MFSEKETSMVNTLLKVYLREDDKTYFKAQDEVAAFYNCSVNCSMSDDYMHVYLDNGKCMYQYSVKAEVIESD